MVQEESYQHAVAFISDIHANLEALDAVLADIEKQNVDGIYCLGDIVGYGPDPQECLQKIRALQTSGKLLRMVCGNHDYEVVHQGYAKFHEASRVADEWTAKVLQGTPQWLFLEELANSKLVQEVGRFVLVHSTLIPPPEKWEYLRAKNVGENFVDRKILFVGHSHSPALYSRYSAGKEWNPIALFENEGFFFLPPVKKDELGAFEACIQYRLKVPGTFPTMIVNVGSVGQPRDDNPCGRYVIYRTVDYDDYIEYRQVGYDVRKTVEKHKKRNLECDKDLAIRLITGGKSSFAEGTQPPPWYPF